MKTTTVWINRGQCDWAEWNLMLLRASVALDACALPVCHGDRWVQWLDNAVCFYGTPSECRAVGLALEGLGLDISGTAVEEAA